MKISRKIVAMCASLSCAVAFGVVGVSTAFADEAATDDGTVTVAITIVDNEDSSNPDCILNVPVEVEEDATVEEALQAAGMEHVDSVEATADGESFTSSDYGYPLFNGKNFSADYSKYWACCYNGEYDAAGTQTALNSTVTAGGHYQYVFDTVPYDPVTYVTNYSFNYSDFDLKDPLSSASFRYVLKTSTYMSDGAVKTAKLGAKASGKEAKTYFNRANVEILSAHYMLANARMIAKGLSDATEKADALDRVSESEDDWVNSANRIALMQVPNSKVVKVKKSGKKTAVKKIVTLKSIKSQNGDKTTYQMLTKSSKVSVTEAGKLTVKKGAKIGTKVKVRVFSGIQSKDITVTVKAA